MRISTLSFMTSSLPGIQDSQSTIARLSQQIATGQRILDPRDDPLGAQQAMQLSSSIATRSQYVANQTEAGQTLNEESTVLQGMQSALDSARTMLQQTNASDSQVVRDQHAVTLSGFYLQIQDFANSRDSAGNYLFAGFNIATQPYQATPVYPTITAAQPATYTGTPIGDPAAPQGVRTVTIEEGGNKVQVSDNLQNVLKFASPVSIPYSVPVVPATNPPTYTATPVSTSDVFQAIDQLAIALHDPNLPSNQVQQAVNDTVNALTATLGSLQNVQTRVATAQVQINDTQTASKSRLTLDQNALSDLTQVDQASAIIQLQSRQTSLQAAESAFAQTSKLSMFNYL